MPVESDFHPATRTVLDWYAVHARTLPWRAPPGAEHAPDPYHVWLSEVMLQQTTVAAVRPYFEKVLARWPTITALAEAADQDIFAAWAGLGYYRRARNLIAAARVIVDEFDGCLPTSASELRTLPGIGDYTAAAIAAFAFGADTIPLDANLERVLARLFAVDTPLPRAKPILLDHARSLWPAQQGGDVAQALMDLGSQVCIARNPRCDHCPLNGDCAARALGIQGQLPIKLPKRKRPEKFGRAWWIVRDDMLWLIRRPANGLLGGMRALPGASWDDGPQLLRRGHAPLGTVRHVFTHFALTLSVDAAPPALAVGEGEWWPLKTLDAAGLPTLYRRAAALALGRLLHDGDKDA